METQSDQNQSLQFGAIKAFFWDLFKIVAISLVIIIPFRLLVAEPFVVSGSSMAPNFQNKDYLIVDRLFYPRHKPQRGDVIVFKYPKDNRQYFIKRIIGLPGETVELAKGKVKIISPDRPSGFELAEAYLPAGTPTLGKSGALKLGSGEYLVLGDNRTASSDSRVWGVLPEKNIVGRAFIRIFPLDGFGLVKTPRY